MGSPASIDVQLLTTAISSDAPTGTNLRTLDASSLYHRLKDARTAARTQERQNVDPTLIDRKSWEQVYELSLEILQTLSKDLEVCAWLIEALVRKFGYAGLRDGYLLTNELITKFWDTLYPQPDEDGVFTRIAALNGLNGEEKDGTLIIPLSNIPLTQSKNGSSFSLWQYKQASNIEHITDPKKKDKQQQTLGLSLEIFKKAILDSSPEFLKNLIADIQEALTEYSRFDTLISEKVQHDAPATSTIRGLIQEALDAMHSLTQDILKDETNNDPANLITAAAPSSSTKSSSVNQISSREGALSALLELSDFFKRTEPHSPLSYILARTVKWGKLSLPELMIELINDSKVRAEYCLLAGIDPPSTNSN